MRAALRMMGAVLTTPIGIAHEATHAYAAALAAGEPPVIEVDPHGAHCFVDFESAARWQRPVIALAPTLVALVATPLLWLLAVTVGLEGAAIAAVALAHYGFPSRADRQQARLGLGRHATDDTDPSGAD